MALALKERVDSAIRARYYFACQNIALLIRVPEMTDAENDIREAAAVQVIADAFEKSIEAVTADVAKFGIARR